MDDAPNAIYSLADLEAALQSLESNSQINVQFRDDRRRHHVMDGLRRCCNDARRGGHHRMDIRPYGDRVVAFMLVYEPPRLEVVVEDLSHRLRACGIRKKCGGCGHSHCKCKSKRSCGKCKKDKCSCKKKKCHKCKRSNCHCDSSSSSSSSSSCSSSSSSSSCSSSSSSSDVCGCNTGNNYAERWYHRKGH